VVGQLGYALLVLVAVATSACEPNASTYVYNESATDRMVRFTGGPETTVYLVPARSGGLGFRGDDRGMALEVLGLNCAVIDRTGLGARRDVIVIIDIKGSPASSGMDPEISPLVVNRALRPSAQCQPSG
jgi:hypothetical protein